MSNLAIETRGLTRDFPSVRAVDALDLRVPQGMVYGFLGPNGAGKTTTLHLLLGLLTPTAGTMRVLGLDPLRDGTEVRRDCGVLLEHHGLYERLSAEENLLFHARAHGMPRDAARARVGDVLEQIGLFDRRKDAVGTWSKGMKQKCAIARVLVHRPRLIFLDEPTNGLDPASAVELREYLVRIAREEGVTVFLTTHNLAEAEKTCERVAVIRKGTLVAEGRPSLLGGPAGRRSVRLTGSRLTAKVARAVLDVAGVRGCDVDAGSSLRIELDPDASAAPVVRAVVEAGADVEEVRTEQTGLEEAFLRFMREEADR